MAASSFAASACCWRAVALNGVIASSDLRILGKFGFVFLHSRQTSFEIVGQRLDNLRFPLGYADQAAAIRHSHKLCQFSVAGTLRELRNALLHNCIVCLSCKWRLHNSLDPSVMLWFTHRPPL